MSSQWITYARLQHAMRDLNELERNVSPRLKMLSEQFNLSGAIYESYELENIRRYIRRMLEDAYSQIQNHYAAIVPSIATWPAHQLPQTPPRILPPAPTPRTTPLLYLTDDDTHSS